MTRRAQRCWPGPAGHHWSRAARQHYPDLLAPNGKDGENACWGSNRRAIGREENVVDNRTGRGLLVVVDEESELDDDIPVALIGLREKMIRRALAESIRSDAGTRRTPLVGL